MKFRRSPGRHRRKTRRLVPATQGILDTRSVATEQLEDRCLLSAQVIIPMPDTVGVLPDSMTTFQVVYSTTDPANAKTTGLVLSMHYNSSELTPDIDAIKASAFPGVTIQDSSEPNGGLEDLPGTDRYVNLLWFDFLGQFPAGGSLPLTLFTATFATTATFDGESVLFTANPPVGYEFNSTPAVLLALQDYGDAPDTGTGTGTGNYRTTKADNGPSHRIVNGLRLGANVDGIGEDGTLQNAQANADDVDGALPDDEDGVLDAQDLQGTIGAAPAITLLATNTTGRAATLYGWIDYNQDGVFDNATERASVSVSDGTTSERFTLTFGTIPEGATGTTYARFRLSTDTAAASSIGAASDGEVEDYVFTITAPSSGTVDHFLKIASDTNGGPTLNDSDLFGQSVTSIGDLDGDGINDLVVGAKNDDTGGTNRGAVYILLMNADGTVKSSTKIASGISGGPTLKDGDGFGEAVAALGDLDGDGITDLAVGAIGDGTTNVGAVYILLLNADGTAKHVTRIASNKGGGPGLSSYDHFGASVASIGDFDGDGIGDLAVGVRSDNTGSADRGAVYVLLLNSNGTVRSHQKIADGVGGLAANTLKTNDSFGFAVASVGDLNGDGITDLAVGANGDDTGGNNRGAVHVLFMNSDGTVKSSRKIASNTNGGPTLANSDNFGSSVTSVGDLDGDGIHDLAVGATGDDTGGDGRGAVHVLLLNADGTVKNSTKIASDLNGGPTLANSDVFGSSVTSVGDLNGDGINDLAVGA
ncbi:MAG: FG-GAP repeat protein, partial [Rhodopirellula sp.]|nr:FG-GAP repeat protein [Rhodopirellula sp.]